MLRVRHPSSLGLDIPILSSLPWVGSLFKDLSICSAVPVSIIPGLKDLVAQVGCNDAGKTSLRAYLATKGGVVGTIGAETIINCVCNGGFGNITAPGTNVADTSSDTFKNPLVWIGISAAVLGTLFYVSSSSKKRRSAAAKTSSSSSTPTVNVNVER